MLKQIKYLLKKALLLSILPHLIMHYLYGCSREKEVIHYLFLRLRGIEDFMYLNEKGIINKVHRYPF
jgi:hypothetical protein